MSVNDYASLSYTLVDPNAQVADGQAVGVLPGPGEESGFVLQCIANGAVLDATGRVVLIRCRFLSKANWIPVERCVRWPGVAMAKK